MDADTVLRIKPALTKYLHEFDGCFGRITARRHLDTYVQGQLGDLPRKSIEPMADAAGIPPRTLQEFLGLYRWDELAMRDRMQQRVARRHAHEHSVGLLDETSFLKKGRHTACVQRQHCGAVGKTENCVVSVHLGCATPDFHCLLDGELYLPQATWHEQRQRCRASGIADDVVYRAKWQIGLEQIVRARGNGIRFAWMTFDEGYGGKPPFLRALDEMGQNYVGEVPVNFTAWTQPPALLYREHGNDRMGRPRKFPRLKVKNNPPVAVRHIASYSPLFRRADWQTYHVKDGHKGPMVWAAKRIAVLAARRPRPAHPAASPAGGLQRAGTGEDQVLHQQRPGAHVGRDTAVGGLQPLEDRTDVRGRQGRVGDGPLRGAQVPVHPTSPDSQLRQLSVPGRVPSNPSGGKIRSWRSARFARQRDI